MKLPMIEFPISMFTKTGARGTMLVSEASDMGNRHLQPLFDDSADAGFAVKFKDGAVVKFTMIDIEHDREGDIIGWTYKAIDEKDFTATIFND